MRLIDAYSAKEAIEYTLAGDSASMAERVIDSQPTVDAVPVVRCDDCWMYEEGFCFSRHVGCGSVTQQRKPDDFCSHGKRKEGADNS